MPTFQTVRGMRDLLPDEAERLNFVISKAKQTARLYGYDEIITPLVEPYQLLSAKSGDEIRSRMFTFKDMGDRKVALRPEFTASIARLATTVLKTEPKPLRVFSTGSVYRYDEPQKGRYREFWQSNFELIGSNKPEADAEAMLLTNSLMKSTGLNNYSFKVSHMGVLRGILNEEDVDEKVQNAVLQLMDKKEYDKAFKLVGERSRRALQGLLEIRGNTPLETAEEVKKYVTECEEAEAAADNLLDILYLVLEGGCPVKTVELGFARGLEYYTGAIFEVNVPELEIALGGGGRYDRLIEVFGGESTPAVGVAHGLDRITLAMQVQKSFLSSSKENTIAVIPVNEEMKSEALRISQMLREAGITVNFEVMGRKMAKALEDADRRKADYAVIVGEKELKKGKVVVRDLVKRNQITVDLKELPDKFRFDSK
jgi:histidyl-tRNA synthetase